MGFEQLAALKDQLTQQTMDRTVVRKRNQGQQGRKAAPVNPEVLIIRQLQKQFPIAFPKNPAPKVPLKLGIHNDLIDLSESLGISDIEMQKAIKTWCSGNRYWASIVENAERYDLNGNTVGNVTQYEANLARKNLKENRLQKNSKPNKQSIPE
jgi:ProP effector